MVFRVFHYGEHVLFVVAVKRRDLLQARNIRFLELKIQCHVVFSRRRIFARAAQEQGIVRYYLDGRFRRCGLKIKRTIAAHRTKANGETN